jgi:hypothetical protein
LIHSWYVHYGDGELPLTIAYVFLSMGCTPQDICVTNFKPTSLGGAALVVSVITAWNGYSNVKKKARSSKPREDPAQKSTLT